MRYHIGLGHPLLKGCVGKCPFGWLLLILSFGGFSYGLGRVYKCNNFYLFLFFFFFFFFDRKTTFILFIHKYDLLPKYL